MTMPSFYVWRLNDNRRFWERLSRETGEMPPTGPGTGEPRNGVGRVVDRPTGRGRSPCHGEEMHPPFFFGLAEKERAVHGVRKRRFWNPK